MAEDKKDLPFALFPPTDPNDTMAQIRDDCDPTPIQRDLASGKKNALVAQSYEN